MDSKMRFELFGMDLLEPTAILWNLAVAAASLIFYIQLKTIRTGSGFLKFWRLFFFLFFVASLFGAVGHGWFLYFGLYGKIVPWTSTIFAIAAAEMAMASLLKRGLLRNLIFGITALQLASTLAITAFLQDFLPVAINTIVGLLLIVTPLSIVHQVNYSKHFRLFWIGVITLLPSAFFFLLKINLHPLFTKDDASHLFILICLAFFYAGVKRTASVNRIH